MTSILFVLLPLGKEDSYCSLSNHISLFPQIAQSQKPPAVQVCPDACLELKCSCRYKSNMQISSQFCLKMRIFIYNFSHVCEDELHGLAEMSSGCIQKHEHLKRHWKKKGHVCIGASPVIFMRVEEKGITSASRILWILTTWVSYTLTDL